MRGSDSDTKAPDGFRARIIRIARGRLGTANRTEYAADALGMTEAQARAGGTDQLSWCGLFVTWVYQQAGASINWVLGKGIAFQLKRTSNPQPGDLAYIDQPYQHHAIVEANNGDTIVTLDGNSHGRLVARNTRPRSAFTAFYSVEGINPDENRDLLAGMLDGDEPPTLSLGSRGKHVELWQRLLGNVKIDGIFGHKTERATRRWQRAKETPTLVVDGIVGPKTWDASRDLWA